MRDPRYDILFEPIKLGPVTAKNRFYQVPHCSGMGWIRPKSLAVMRAVKAEGGWGVVCTEFCSIHPSVDSTSLQVRLWDDHDVRVQADATAAIHEHGALAGVELWHGGSRGSNFDSRMPPMGRETGRASTRAGVFHPGQSRGLDKADIRNIRQWHGDAARRAVEAGFDIVYVYATHGNLLTEFLNPATNQRSDEYGGSVANRVRLVRELIEETLDAVAGKAAVVTRFAVDTSDEETYEAFTLINDLPDFWDLTPNDYNVEMGSSRFVGEAAFDDNLKRAKAMTSKPIVAVGRFTTPDAMARVIRAGAQDMIGAARPSIADPFLPKKIEEGRLDDIRECIGCNICYAHDALGKPIRCTQNPTMGEEWRRGWHPERITRRETVSRALVVGAGPAGMEAARVLGERGFDVMLAEASRELGGRVSTECRLPGLAEWARVRDWRVGQIDKLPNVEVYRDSAMTADDVLATDADHVLVATGSRWTTDGAGGSRAEPVAMADGARVVGVEEMLAGREVPGGHALVYDDDHYYMACVLALALRQRGNLVTLATSAYRPAAWCTHTAEFLASNAALAEADVEIVTHHRLDAVTPDDASLTCLYTGMSHNVDVDWVMPVTNRKAVGGLHDALAAHPGDGTAPPFSLYRIGDCDAPGTIAAAVYSGYRVAMDVGAPAHNVIYERVP